MLKRILNTMKGLIPTIKSALKEPKVYALVVNSMEGGILHLGIHHSLEEAIEATGPAVQAGGGPVSGGVPQIEMWTALDGADVVRSMVDFQPADLKDEKKIQIKKKSLKRPVAVRPKNMKDHIDTLRKTKNELMKSLIKDGTLGDVDKTESLLSDAEKKLITQRIKARKKNEKSKK
jgi:hypothetical protein